MIELLNTTSNEIDAVINALNITDKMLEFGCGGSTLTFSKYVNVYNSIEHDKTWMKKVKSHIETSNICLKYVKCYYPDNNIHCDYSDPDHKLRWANYYTAASIFPEQYYNKIYIDGRARAYCAIDILKYIDKDSIVFIHDYGNRPKYHKELCKYYNLKDQIDTLAILTKK